MAYDHHQASGDPSPVSRERPLDIGTIVIPKYIEDEELRRRLVEKTKEFRLASLNASPEAFASTYEREVAFDDNIWFERQANPLATTIVSVLQDLPSVDETAKPDITTLPEKEWLGTAVLVELQESGQLGASSAVAQDGDQLNESSDETLRSRTSQGTIKFMLNGVYVCPRWRMHGVGTRLLQQAVELEVSKARERGCKLVEMGVRVFQHNEAAFRSYRKAGFQHVATEDMSVARQDRAYDGQPDVAQNMAVLVLQQTLTIGGGSDAVYL